MIILIVVAVVVVGILALLLACLIKKCKKGKTDTVAPTEGEAVPKQIDVEAQSQRIRVHLREQDRLD